jgi:hypothetical protein
VVIIKVLGVKHKSKSINMRNLLWCANHQPLQEQLDSLNEMGNIIFLKDIAPDVMNQLANTPPSRSECRILAGTISVIAEELDAKIVQLGGSPLFLVMASPIIGSGRMIFADSDRISEDIPQPDGSVKKISTFRHKGWS